MMASGKWRRGNSATSTSSTWFGRAPQSQDCRHTHNVFGIQTGVAIGFFVRDKAELGECNIHYAAARTPSLRRDKLAYLGKAQTWIGIAFEDITPDEKGSWLNQSNSDFEKLMPLANRQTKLAKRIEDEQAVFGLYS